MATLPETYSNPLTGLRFHTEPVSLRHGHLVQAKVIESPGVYLVAAMELHEGSINEFLRDHQIKEFSPWGDPDADKCGRNARGTDHELLVELSGRICYMSYEKPRPGGVAAFLENLKAEGHGSVLEHPHYSFIFSGVSRNLTLEANRHRPFSISQLSGRFVDASEVGFVADPDLTASEREQWLRNCVTAYESYREQYDRNYARNLERWRKEVRGQMAPVEPSAAELTPTKKVERKLVKRARERARDILPGCLETRVLYTVNARAIRFVIEKRCHADAAFEIRRVFNRVFRILKNRDPGLFCDFKERELDDGTFAVETPYQKV